jgi:hypothetical protein
MSLQDIAKKFQISAALIGIPDDNHQRNGKDATNKLERSRV